MQKKLVSLLLFLSLMAGVYLIHYGLTDLFAFIGQDSAAPGDTVGVLHIYSTRQILFSQESLAAILLGLVLVIGAGAAYRRFYPLPSAEADPHKAKIHLEKEVIS